jgi:FOG: CheY-like receiver
MPAQPLYILMVDDDSEDLELMEEAFSNASEGNVTLCQLADGNQVLSYLDGIPDEQLPCLIILDYNMPGMKGSEVLALLCSKERYKPIPKVILSTSNAKLHVEECKRNGAVGYFVKPNNLKEVSELAATMLQICKAA